MYKLIAVKHKDVSFKVWAVREIDLDFLPMRVKETSAPQTQTIHIYANTHILGLWRVYITAHRLEFSQLISPFPARPSASFGQ